MIGGRNGNATETQGDATHLIPHQRHRFNLELPAELPSCCHPTLPNPMYLRIVSTESMAALHDESIKTATLGVHRERRNGADTFQPLAQPFCQQVRISLIDDGYYANEATVVLLQPPEGL